MIVDIFTAIVVWLILKWNEQADKYGNERYILIIAYMIGLATGLHLLNLLALPFVALIIFFHSLSNSSPIWSSGLSFDISPPYIDNGNRSSVLFCH